MPILKISNLSYAFDTKIIYKNINFEVEKSESMAIIGESGIGKSTLLKTIAGFYEPNAGEIIFKNKALAKANEKLIKGEKEIGFINQENKLFPLISLEENIKYSLKTYNKEFQSKRCQELMELFKINHLAQKLPKNCSGGEVQRAALAQAMAHLPPLLLLDEPFSHLDIINKNICKKAIKKLISKQKVAVVFVTHDLLDALDLTQKLFFMKNNDFIGPIESENLPFFKKDKFIKKYIQQSLKPALDLVQKYNLK